MNLKILHSTDFFFIFCLQCLTIYKLFIYFIAPQRQDRHYRGKSAKEVKSISLTYKCI